MDTRLFSNNKKFFHLDKETSGSLPFFVFPAVWFEKKKSGLSVSSVRVTFGIFRYRFHLQIGRRHEEPNPSLILPSRFIDWASAWSKTSISQADFEVWLRQSPFQDIVRWGGCSDHYTKILIVREFLSAKSRSSVRPKPLKQPEDTSLPLSDEDFGISLDITWDDVNVAPNQSTGNRFDTSESGYR